MVWSKLLSKYPVAVIGATGMVGQRFLTLLADHPWFDVVCVAASPRSAGRSYEDAVADRWVMPTPIPDSVRTLKVLSALDDIDIIADNVRLAFCAEINYAARGVMVVSNNSAHRWTENIPMIIPEVNGDHLALIDSQRRQHGWSGGGIVVKPNCSIQSYVMVLSALAAYKPLSVRVTSLQAVSGAGRTRSLWPDMQDNLIPFIGGEEEKSEKEPLKIWGNLMANTIQIAEAPTIHATCIRVPVSDGHMANVAVKFAISPNYDEITAAIESFNKTRSLGETLPSAPKQPLQLLLDDDRPQTKQDRDYENGMGVTLGRLRPDSEYDWQFIALAHNTLRGAAGGAVLTAELLVERGYLD